MPAALFYLWSDLAPESCRETVAGLLPEAPGLVALDPPLFALVPTANRPGEISEAVSHAQRLLLRLERRFGVARCSVLVLPGEVETAAGEAGEAPAFRAVPDALLEDLGRRPPAVELGGVYLTGYAASRAGGIFELKACANYQGVSGRTVPLLRLLGRCAEILPWKNPNLLGRASEAVERPLIERRLLSLAGQRILRVAGPLGCGKTRTVWQVLGSPGCQEDRTGQQPAARLWLFARPRWSSSPSFARQLLWRLVALRAGSVEAQAQLQAARELGLETWYGEGPDEIDEGGSGEVGGPLHEALVEALVGALVTTQERLGAPIRLLFDSLEAAESAELAFLGSLLGEPRLLEGFGFVLIGRQSTAWPRLALSTPRLDIPFLQPAEISNLGKVLFRGLSMPQEVQDALVAASGGSPFALEEGLLRMVHDKRLRRVYGSFFYSGAGDAGYQPSPRLVQHLESEALGLGRPTALRLLALAGQPVPARELGAAAALLDDELPAQWETPYLNAGWLTPALSPWGPALEFTGAAYARAMARTVSPECVDAARRALGEILSHTSDHPDGRWRAYELLSGSRAAVSPILELAASQSGEVPQEKLLESLVKELAAHRQRQGDAATELQLLWILLPLARRLGSLETFESDVARALELAASEPNKLLAFASIKAELDLQQGRLEEGEKTLRGALELALEGDTQRQALVLIQLGRLLMRQDRSREARTLFEQLLPALVKRRATALVASCRYYLGNIALAENRLDDAFEHHRSALELRKPKGRKSLGLSWSALGAVALGQGHYPKAIENYRKALEKLEEFGDEGDVSSALVGLGRTLGRLGDHLGAGGHLRRALELRLARPDVVGEAAARLAMAGNHLKLGRPTLALEEARKTHFQLSLLGTEVNLLGHTEQVVGRIHLALRNLEDARAHFEAARTIHQRRGDELATAEDHSWLLELALLEDDAQRIQHLCRDLDRHSDLLQKSERAEVHRFRLYRGFERLRRLGLESHDPMPYLRSAFAELMRKSEPLDSDQRQRFLFQIPENAALLDAATANQLTLPA